MGVYIKGMEMPKSCDYCDFFEAYSESIGYCRILNSQIPCDCPLVPVPPHGQLVDALKVIDTFPDDYVFTNEQARALTNCVIPAEEGLTRNACD